MKHIRGLISTTQALRQIFLVPQTIPRARFTLPGHVQISSQPRTFHSSSPRSRYRGPGASETPNKPGQLKDEAIRAQYVRLVNEDGNLDPPEKLSDILRSIERPANFVLQVSPNSHTNEPPVCKIVNRALLAEAERASAKAARAAKVSVKQVELNWAIDNNDLTHRLKQITTFIEKGAKVEICLLRKRHKRAPTIEEVKSVMDKVLQTVKDAGAVQTKAMEGEPGKRLTLSVKKKE
ncbi:translation initiation factor IF-3, C-terminal domain-containing protein [Aspergillus granulosus]|uniref:Translation initiation factor IF-3, C-terminal domain-containing protein n=1 Tax=Aspergillus granulosus TaxID=176169 RepID=A0ABR4GW23_9EURO